MTRTRGDRLDLRVRRTLHVAERALCIRYRKGVPKAPNIEDIVAIVVEAAETDIRPFFRRLQAGDIHEKSPGELVTIADTRCEATITSRLKSCYPSIPVIGEEQSNAMPWIHNSLATLTDYWLLDPLDGTTSFAQGSPDHAVMLALVHHGDIVLSVIHQPEYGKTFLAEHGAGVRRYGDRVRRYGTPEPLGIPTPDRLAVSVHDRFMTETEAAAISSALGALETFRGSTVPSTEVAGVEYPRLAEQGDPALIIFGRTLPWDHAPGALMTRESGGSSIRFDGSEYSPSRPGRGIIASLASVLEYRDEIIRELAFAT